VGGEYRVRCSIVAAASRTRNATRRAQAATITFREAAKARSRASVVAKRRQPECAAAVIESRESGWSAEHARQWRASIAEVDSTLASLPVALWLLTQARCRSRPPNQGPPEPAGASGRPSTAHGARSGDNPARHLLRGSHKVRHHEAMPYNAVPSFMGELRVRSGTAARALEFLILCASRSGEVLGARWSEIDIEQKTWTIPGARMKADKYHTVPLAPSRSKFSPVNCVIPNLSLLRLEPAGRWSVTHWPM
jgi:hypothetical protein